MTFGIGLKPIKNLNITLDYYRIKVKDRIVLGNLVDFGAGGQAFFVNGINSKTSGLDFVMNYRNIALGSGKLGLNVSGNYTLDNKIDGAVKNPRSVQLLGTPAYPTVAGQNPALAGQTVFNQTQDALMFTSRPKFKYIYGADYQIEKWGLSLNNTVFGPTKFKNADFSNVGLSTNFATKMVTDLGVTYAATKKATISFNANNLFNVLPKYTVKSDGSASANAIENNPAALKNEIANITFDGRYSQMTYDGFQFSQLGRMFSLSLNYKF